jgi:hypothetical protein
MDLSVQMAKQFRDLHFGGNWTAVNLRDSLSTLGWEEATRKVNGFNTIVALAYHIHYYVLAVLPVLQGGSLQASDKFSFDHPPILSQEDWEHFLAKIWADAETFAATLERLPDDRMWEPFADGTYGNYFRNVQGVIEHAHYHLGQIVLIRKILRLADGRHSN